MLFEIVLMFNRVKVFERLVLYAIHVSVTSMIEADID